MGCSKTSLLKLPKGQWCNWRDCVVWLILLIISIVWPPLQSITKVLESTVPYFGLNGLPMILCLWSLLLPFSKLQAIQDDAQNLEDQLWMGGRRDLSIILHRSVTTRDLKKERAVFRLSVSTFLQLVVAWYRRSDSGVRGGVKQREKK